MGFYSLNKYSEVILLVKIYWNETYQHFHGYISIHETLGYRFSRYFKVTRVFLRSWAPNSHLPQINQLYPQRIQQPERSDIDRTALQERYWIWTQKFYFRTSVFPAEKIKTLVQIQYLEEKKKQKTKQNWHWAVSRLIKYQGVIGRIPFPLYFLFVLLNILGRFEEWVT